MPNSISNEHPLFFYSEMNDCWEVEGTLLRIPRDMIRNNSEALQGILSKIPSLASAVAGDRLGTRDDPIVIPNTPLCEVEAYLTALCLGRWQHVHMDLTQLKALLSFSKRWELSDTYRWALEEINKRRFLPPSQAPSPVELMQLAYDHNIKPWVGKLFRTLLRRGILELKPAEAALLPPLVYRVLATATIHTRDIIDQLAFYPPKLPDIPVFADADHDHSICSARWREYWIMEVGRQMKHPVTPLRPSGLEEFFEHHPVATMDERCRDMGVLAALDSPLLDATIRIEDRAVGFLEDLVPHHHYSYIDNEVITR